TSTAISAAGSATRPKPSAVTAATVVTVSPTACAKRLGGPAVGIVGPSRGAMTCAASRPSGLSCGPAITRSRKPTAMSAVSQCHPVTRTVAPSTATIVATTRAARSLTTAGKVKVWLGITTDYGGLARADARLVHDLGSTRPTALPDSPT